MCDTEVYTIRVDSVYATSNTSFIGYLNIPLRNVVKAELLSVSLHANATSPSTTSMYYIHVDELKCKFLDRTDLSYYLSVGGNAGSEGITPSGTVSNVGYLATSLVGIPVTNGIPDYRTIFTTGNYFPVEVTYFEPIRKIERLTINVFTANGAQPNITDGATFLTFRFTCAKPNTCLYPN